MIEPTLPKHFRGLRPHKLFVRLAEEPILGPVFLQQGKTLVEELHPRVLETIALRVAARRDCRYVWAGHCVIATQHPTDPLSVEEIQRIAHGSPLLRGSDALLVRAVDELLDQYLSGSARAVLGSRALRVTLATGFYDTVATLMRDEAPEGDVPVILGLETPSIAARNAADRPAPVR